MKYLLLAFAFFVVANAVAADLSQVTLHAAAPLCYDHRVGGGAYNDGTIGRDADVVNSLNGGDFKCYDLVSFISEINMKSSVVTASQCFDIYFRFTADTTGQAGVALGDVLHYQLNFPTLQVENGDGGNSPNRCANGKGEYGYDSGYKSYASTVGGVVYPKYNENASYIPNSRKTQPGQIFTGNSADLYYGIRVCGLEANEKIILRHDVEIQCIPESHPTGTLQGFVHNASALTCGSASCDVSVGNQNVPLKNLDEIINSCQAIGDNPIVASDFTAVVEVTNTEEMGPSAYYMNLWYSWSAGVYKTVIIGTNFTTVKEFDTECSFLHKGIIEYAQSTCGCEATFVSETQPQLFLSLNSSYFNQTHTNITVDGVVVSVFTRISDESAVTTLYVLASNRSIIVQADFYDGTTWKFTNVKLGAINSSVFVVEAALGTNSTPTCNCKRSIALHMAIQRDKRVTFNDMFYVDIFAGTIVPNGFLEEVINGQLQFTRALIGVDYYDSTSNLTRYPNVQLPMKDGTNRAQVFRAVRSIGCATASGKADDPCGAVAAASLIGAIATGIDNLKSITYPQGQKSILLINHGYAPEPAASVLAAVQKAVSANIRVYAVVYRTGDSPDEMRDVMVSNRDYLVHKFLAADLDDDPNTAPYYTWPQDILSRICVGQEDPCGECCGVCFCNECHPNTEIGGSCVSSNNCSIKIEEDSNGCCKQVPLAVDCPSDGCNSYTCNPATGTCDETPTCVNVSTDACYYYNCVNGQCIQTLKAADTYCTNYYCENNVIKSTSTNICPSADNCSTYVCNDTLKSCLNILIPDDPINVLNRNCRYCNNSLSGWVSKTCPQSSNLCVPQVCNAANGTCTAGTPVVCPTGDKCGNFTCSPGTGQCVEARKVCPNLPCKTLNNVTYRGGCNPETGECEYLSRTLCPTVTSCCGGTPVRQECDETTDSCACPAACPPTNAPTKAPTKAPTPPPPTPAPTEEPTDAPTAAPTVRPTEAPTTPPPVGTPTNPPTPEPTDAPTVAPTVRPTKAPTPAPTLPAPTEEPTEAPTVSCNCPPKFCSFTPCNASGQCSPNPILTNCTEELERTLNGDINTCLEPGNCIEEGGLGCVFTSKVCTPSTNLCTVTSYNTSLPGCCQYKPKDCGPNTGCNSFSCDPTDGVCKPTTLCTGESASNKCTVNICDGTQCVNVDTICPAETDCYTYSCEPSTGQCVSQPKSCSANSDADLCVSAVCIEGRGCVPQSVTCPNSNKCVNISCDPLTGGCASTPTVCDDNIFCTVDTCDVVLGCIHTENNSFCSDTDPCTNESTFICDKNAGGCVANRTECDPNTYCTNFTCIDGFGCAGIPRNCIGNASNTSCTTYNCSDDAAECLKIERKCFNFLGVVVGIIIGALVGGLLGAAAVCVGLSAGGAAAAYSGSTYNDEDRAIKSNPLFQGQGKGAQGLANGH